MCLKPIVMGILHEAKTSFKRKWTSRLSNHLLHIFTVPDFARHLNYIAWCTGKYFCSVREHAVFAKIFHHFLQFL